MYRHWTRSLPEVGDAILRKHAEPIEKLEQQRKNAEDALASIRGQIERAEKRAIRTALQHWSVAEIDYERCKNSPARSCIYLSENERLALLNLIRMANGESEMAYIEEGAGVPVGTIDAFERRIRF